MDLRQLRYFVGIVEAGSMSRAAERLHVAQSALSQHVRRMEEDLQVRLLVRVPTGVRPTPAGSRLLKHARQILEQVKAAEHDLHEFASSPSGAVAVGIPPAVARVLNVPLLEAARREYPGISLRIVDVNPAHVDEWLAQGLIALGIVYDLHGERAGNLLAEEDYYLVSGRPEPRLVSGVTLDGLRRYPLIMPTCTHNPRHCIITYAGEQGIDLTVENRVDSLNTILDLTMNQAGRTVLSPSAFFPELADGKLFAYPLSPRLTRTVLLVAGDQADHNPAARAIELLISQVAAELLAGGDWRTQLPPALRLSA